MKTGLLATGLTILLAATACGEVTGTPSAEPSRSAPPSSTSAPSKTKATTKPTSRKAEPSTAGLPADATKPGSELAMGSPAKLPIKSGRADLVEVTVTSIVKGEPADLAALNLGADGEGKVPYYIHFTVKNIDGGAHGGSLVTGIRGLFANGDGAGRVITLSKFPKCDTNSAPREFTTVGATYESCELVLGDPANAVIAAAFATGEFYLKDPVVWK